MSKRRARYSAEFKQDAVSRMGQRGKTVTALAEELGVGRKFYTCGANGCRLAARRRWSERRGRPPGGKSKSVSQPAVGAAELRIAELERLLGRSKLELDFSNEPSSMSRSSRRSYQRWRRGSILAASEATLSFEGVGLDTVERQCQLAEVSP